jgi:hypothetical protein
MKKFSPFFHKAIPTEEDCRRMKAELDYYRPRLDKALGEGFLKLFKAVVLEFNERKKIRRGK